jgi:TAT (twin-arginine translocation) pathway signal sequence.
MKIKPKAIMEPASFVSGKALSRRALLRGAGAAIALPMLGAMTPAFANAPEKIHRIPNGLYP